MQKTTEWKSVDEWIALAEGQPVRHVDMPHSEPPRRSWEGKPRTQPLLTREEAKDAADLADRTSIGHAARQYRVHRNTLVATWTRWGIRPRCRRARRYADAQRN